MKWFAWLIYYTVLFASNLRTRFLCMCDLGHTVTFIDEPLWFKIKLSCSDVCGYQRSPQTLTAICRNMSVCDSFGVAAAKENIRVSFSHNVYPRMTSWVPRKHFREKYPLKLYDIWWMLKNSKSRYTEAQLDSSRIDVVIRLQCGEDGRYKHFAR